MVWYFIGVNIITMQNVTWPLGETETKFLFAALTREMFFNIRAEISYLHTAMWYPLFLTPVAPGPELKNL